MPELLLLENLQSPGDTLMFTCAVRDLHKAFPGEYVTAVHTPTPDIWKNNPYISNVTPGTGRVLRVGYSRSIKQCNSRRAHFATGFVQHLSELIQRRFLLTELKADVHLTDEEMAAPPTCVKKPYWLIMAGGKRDFTAKIWDTARWQETVDMLQGSVHFVQVGGFSHLHKPLTGVTNLLGKTSFRDLMQLTYHAEGCACQVTSLMHLAACFNKPCVVVAGGREPWWWEAYTRQTWAINADLPVPAGLVDQRYLHTLGRLPCCKSEGCWRSGVGEKEKGGNCRDIVQGATMVQPKCMTLITAEDVAKAVHDYERGYAVAAEPVHSLRPPLFMEPLPPLEAPAAVVKKGVARVAARQKPVFAHQPKPGVPVKLPLKPPVWPPKTKPRNLVIMNGKPVRDAQPVKRQLKKVVSPTSPVLADEYTQKLKHVPLPLTVCVLTYGDYLPLVRRCVDSLYNTLPTSLFTLRLGMNEVSSSVRSWADTLMARGNVLLYPSQTNIFKYPMMRRMFSEPALPEGWVLWFDDDSYVERPDWLFKMAEHMRPGHGVLGKKYFSHLKPGQPAWIEKASWYRGIPLELRKGQPISTFATGGFWAAQTEVIARLGWPDPRLENNGGDVMFGAACWQNNVAIKQVFDGSVRISAHPRRGASQRHPGT